MCDIPKPKMRGLGIAYIKRSVIISVTLALCTAYAWKVIVNDTRAKIWNDYYENFDPEVSLKYMEKHLQSTGGWKPPE